MVEGLARWEIDRQSSATIRQGVELRQIEAKLASSFVQHLTKAGCFQTTEYVAGKNQDDHTLLVAGYDAVVRLSVLDILLDRTFGDNVRLRVRVTGQVTNLKARGILWDRDEVVESSEVRSLDYYKEYGLKDLDPLLEKAAQTLSYDFIYPN